MSEYATWKSWEKESFGKPTLDEVARYKIELKKSGFIINNEASVLEIGFGNGGFLAYARKSSKNIIGVELNDQLIELANEAGFHAIHYSNFSKLKKCNYDLIVAFDVLEHVDKLDVIQFISSVKGLLKPGGTFIARVPNGDSPFSMVNQNGDLTHKISIGSELIKYFASYVGFNIVYIGKSAQPILNVPSIYAVQRIFSLPFKFFLVE